MKTDGVVCAPVKEIAKVCDKPKGKDVTNYTLICVEIHYIARDINMISLLLC